MHVASELRPTEDSEGWGGAVVSTCHKRVETGTQPPVPLLGENPGPGGGAAVRWPQQGDAGEGAAGSHRADQPGAGRAAREGAGVAG